jgi:vacuolar-type H+-ATPase subunit H
MSNSTERYNDYIEQLAREDIREAEIKYQENVAELEEAKRQVWNEALEQAAQIVDPAPNAKSGRWAENIRRKAAAIRAMKKEKP